LELESLIYNILNTLLNILNTYSTLVVAIATLVLAAITAYYAWETRLIRKIGQIPSFSLEPTLYSLGGRFYRLLVVNTGQAATNIVIECKWENESKSFYILSLSHEGRALLEGLPIARIVENKSKLFVNISCQYAKSKTFTTKINIDFAEKLKANSSVAYQYNHTGNISDTLEEIRRSLDHLTRDFIQATKSNKPQLSVDLRIAKSTVVLGDEQEFIVTVIDPETQEKMLGANVNYKIILPSGSRYESNADDLTDENGNLSVKYRVSEIGIGKYRAIFWASARGYRPAIKSLTFEAIERSNS
jgi:hypothetical protein